MAVSEIGCPHCGFKSIAKKIPFFIVAMQKHMKNMHGIDAEAKDIRRMFDIPYKRKGMNGQSEPTTSFTISSSPFTSDSAALAGQIVLENKKLKRANRLLIEIVNRTLLELVEGEVE
jgi:predicted small metal-binding protein